MPSRLLANAPASCFKRPPTRVRSGQSSSYVSVRPACAHTRTKCVTISRGMPNGAFDAQGLGSIRKISSKGDGARPILDVGWVEKAVDLARSKSPLMGLFPQALYIETYDPTACCLSACKSTPISLFPSRFGNSERVLCGVIGERSGCSLLSFAIIWPSFGAVVGIMTTI